MTDLASNATADDAARAARRAALATLGEAELLAMANSAPVGLYTAVEGVGVILVNERMCEITGLTRGGVLGHGYLGVMHPEDRERILDYRSDARREHLAEITAEYRVVRPDGELRWVRARAVRVRTDPLATFVGSLVDVTEFKQVEAALRESEGRFRAIVEQGFDIVTVLDADLNVAYVSPSAQRLGGYEDAGIGRPATDFIHPDDLEGTLAYYRSILDGTPARAMHPVRIIAADEHVEALEIVARKLEDEGTGELVAVGRIVTDRVEAEVALRASEARLRDQASVLEMIATSNPREDTLAEICRMVEHQIPGARSTVLLVDEWGRTLHHGAAPSFPDSFARAIDGIPVAEGSTICGSAVIRAETVAVRDVVHEGLEPWLRVLAAEHGIHGAWSTPIRSSYDQRVLGTFATYLDSARLPTADEEATVESVLHLAAIAVERTQFEDQLAHQAHHDPLTRLPNRTLFGELLEHSLRRAQRSGSAVAVLFMDLDRFKVVNDSLGHDAGDELLQALAARLEGVLRPGDVVARFGGDEFTVLCEDLEPGVADRQAIGVAERIIDAARAPFRIGNEEQFVSASVGIAISMSGTDRPEALLRDADAAMYRAKERGKDRCEVFDEQMRERARERHETENALHRAVARGEFRVFYQPIISLADGTCVGVEALARWQHPERGLLSPIDFLGAAEETGLVVPIGAWVLEEACRRAVEWRAALGSEQHFRLSVNLSGRQLVHVELADLVAGVLARVGLRPDALCVEITETVLMEDIGAGVAAVKALKALGVRVSIDDFGTGYSALGYLRQFPVDDVKIDRTFVERLGTEPEDAAIVAAVVSLGHALGVTVTGEGVETEAQLAILRDLGVDAAQGYLFAPAQPPDDLTGRLLRPHRWIELP
ncbi:MAG TPA: EAL domain-containing protein [Acidimicrobiia bacterium]|jgi:diguanylate cyclase (GGDEF)-like protein/PAS domain S-box-containing protein